MKVVVMEIIHGVIVILAYLLLISFTFKTVLLSLFSIKLNAPISLSTQIYFNLILVIGLQNVYK